MPKQVTPETALKKACKDFLSLYRIWTFPILQGMGAYPGIADRLGVWDKGVCPHCGGSVPQPLALEFKRPAGMPSPKTGKPMGAGILTPDQKEFGRQWTEKGGLFIPVWSVENLAQGLGLKAGLF